MPSLLVKMKILSRLTKNSWKTEIKLPVKCYLVWKLELVSNIFWMVVGKTLTYGTNTSYNSQPGLCDSSNNLLLSCMWQCAVLDRKYSKFCNHIEWASAAYLLKIWLHYIQIQTQVQISLTFFFRFSELYNILEL